MAEKKKPAPKSRGSKVSLSTKTIKDLALKKGKGDAVKGGVRVR